MTIPHNLGTERTAVLVTGMHRSGTSALARTLSLLGVALPRELVPPNEGNPEGHWEPLRIVELNDRMLADAGSDVYGIADIDPEWFASVRGRSFVDQAERLIEQSFESETAVVLKDPRMALLLPIWHAALEKSGYRVVHVLPLRHPLDVATSLRRRHLKTIPYDAWSQPRGEAVWLRYTLAAVRGTRDHARAFVRYDRLLDKWRDEAVRAGAELGITWPALGGEAEREIDGFLRPNEHADGHHGRLDLGNWSWDGLNILQLSAALYDTLAETGDDRDVVDAIGASFHRKIEASRDLITMFEGLYPLVWTYYNSHAGASAQLEAATAAEDELRASKRQMWSALTQASDEKLLLRQDLNSRADQIASLETQLAQTRVVIEDLKRASESGGQVSHAGTGTGAEEAGMEPHEPHVTPGPAHEDGQAAAIALSQQVAACEAEIEALRNSTSWRVTAPLRTLSRIVRRRS